MLGNPGHLRRRQRPRKGYGVVIYPRNIRGRYD
jgi:hypothetical protein